MKYAISKHRQFDPETGKWIPGKVKIGQASSLRKLMRAARRDKMPDERQALIDIAMGNASFHRALYLNSCRARTDARARTR